MGGNAFRQVMPQLSFPRMSPVTYRALIAALLPRMQPLYALVAVPHEAPEKVDHGDVDFVVAHPRSGLTLEAVKEALGATYSLPLEGNRTSNYAVPTSAADTRSSSTANMDFYQVDVNVCADKPEWERTLFLHSYGDLGMILNLVARSAGLSLGVHGLKLSNALPTSPPIPFHLSSSLSDILAFLGLSKDGWEKGFVTQGDAFDWVATSCLFDAQKIVPSDRSFTSGKKAREVRSMYQNFLAYARERAQEAVSSARAPVTQDDALRFFGKEAEHAALIHTSRVKQHARELFSGELVQDWSGLRGLPVKWVMDAVREKLHESYVRDHGPRPDADLPTITPDGKHANNYSGLPPVVPWELAMFPMSEDDVRMLVLQAKNEMEAAGTFELKWEKEKARKSEKQKLLETTST